MMFATVFLFPYKLVTLITNTSKNDFTNLKDKYLQDFGNYLDSSFNMTNEHGEVSVKRMNFCDTLPPPGFFGIAADHYQSISRNSINI